MKLNELKALSEYIDVLIAEASDIQSSKGYADRPYPASKPSDRDARWYSHGFGAGMEHAALAMMNMLGYAKIDEMPMITSEHKHMATDADIKAAYESIGNRPSSKPNK